MAESALSTGDLALMRDNDGFGGGNGFFWGICPADFNVRR